jgi:hypothetical protein
MGLFLSGFLVAILENANILPLVMLRLGKSASGLRPLDGIYLRLRVQGMAWHYYHLNVCRILFRNYLLHPLVVRTPGDDRYC